MLDWRLTKNKMTDKKQEPNKETNPNDKHLDLISDKVTPLLKNCLIQNIRTNEVANISSRIIKILEGAFGSLDKTDPLVREGLRGIFLKRTKALLQNTNVKLNKDSKDIKIETIAHKAIESIMDGELFDEDNEWMNQYVDGIINKFVYDLIKHYFEMFFQKTEFAMLKNWDDAELLTFGKEQDRFTMKELDELLKSGHGFNAWLGMKRKLGKGNGKKLILQELAEKFAEGKEGVVVQKLVDKVKACNWDKGFREFCLDEFYKK